MIFEGFHLDHCAEELGECLEYALIVNRGDDVQVLETRDEIVGFLAPIDTPLEAAWVATLGGERVVQCSPGARATDDGFEVALERGCPSTVMVVAVDESGGEEVVGISGDGDCNDGPEQIE